MSYSFPPIHGYVPFQTWILIVVRWKSNGMKSDDGTSDDKNRDDEKSDDETIDSMKSDNDKSWWKIFGTEEGGQVLIVSLGGVTFTLSNRILIIKNRSYWKRLLTSGSIPLLWEKAGIKPGYSKGKGGEESAGPRKNQQCSAQVFSLKWCRKKRYFNP